MQRTPRTASPRVSTAMRRSILQLEQKARWLRPVGRSLPPAVTQPKKRAAGKPRRPTRTLSTILEEYRQTLEHLESIEGELAEWLNGPIEVPSETPAGDAAINLDQAPAPAANESVSVTNPAQAP